MTDFPEEYTDGYVIFMGQKIKTDPRALIPRLETEELVKYCLNLLGTCSEIQTLADIGTGSGVIPISIMKKHPEKLTTFATDMSQDALELARDNAHQNNAHISFLQGNLLKPLIQHWKNSSPEHLLMTANLPYVREKEINAGLTHEPRMAFLGGVQTGFELYEEFFKQLIEWKERPKHIHLVIEFGLWQRDIAETVFQTYNWEYTFFADLRGIERFAHICLSR